MNSTQRVDRGICWSSIKIREYFRVDMDTVVAWLIAGKIYLFLEEARMRRKMICSGLRLALAIFKEFRFKEKKKSLLQHEIFILE